MSEIDLNKVERLLRRKIQVCHSGATGNHNDCLPRWKVRHKKHLLPVSSFFFSFFFWLWSEVQKVCFTKSYVARWVESVIFLKPVIHFSLCGYKHTGTQRS